MIVVGVCLVGTGCGLMKRFGSDQTQALPIVVYATIAAFGLGLLMMAQAVPPTLELQRAGYHIQFIWQ
jgi:hypothetical protein